jgi:glycosyltransferase involved in cell wall biosynthesis
MKILIVASDKGGHFTPFIEEQIAALQEIGVQVVRHAVTGKGILGYLRELPALKQMIRAEQPDVVHAHFGLSGVLANLQRRVPVVTTYHGSDINVPEILRFSKIAMCLSAWNIFVSRRNVAIAKPKNKYTMLPCGVNIPKPWCEMQNQMFEQLTLNQWVHGILKKDAKHVLFAGALDNAVKDSALAQVTINQLRSEGIQVELIELKGYNRDQVTALMYNCHALLMTSKTEGSPQVVKEAMACGCPIVSVDVGDVAERIEGVEGCYVVPTREPQDLANALQKAIEFNGRTNGREKIIEMELTNKQVAERLMAIYKDIIKVKG